MHAGLYIHVPFCSAICPYCDFAVLTGGEERRAEYVSRLLAEVELYAGHPFCFDTIYLGGGTPSLLTPRQLTEIFEGLGASLHVDPCAQLFLEANPEDVTAETLEDWREQGAHFVSLGVLSFHDEELRYLGRRHDGDQARWAVRETLAAGLTTVSLDLIYGLPGQSLESWRRTLEEAVELAPQHISCYQLTIHDRTLFGARRRQGTLVELPEDHQACFFELTHEVLDAAGYPAYEVSNFASAPEHRSGHNQKYWNHTPYLGLGPSAHSFDGRRRWWNERQLRAW